MCQFGEMMSPDENKKTTSKSSNTSDHQINNTELFPGNITVITATFDCFQIG